MLNPRSRVQSDIQKGLIVVLAAIATLDDRNQHYIALTTAPSQWLACRPDDARTIVDVSGLLHTTLWQSESDMEDRAYALAQSAGWPSEQINASKRVEVSKSHTIVPDMVLEEISGRPLALVEVKPAAYSDEAVERLVEAAHALGDVQAFITDGYQTHQIDPRSADVKEVPFPTPATLGLAIMPAMPPIAAPEVTQSVLARCDSVESLLGLLGQLGETAVILDFTFPWGFADAKRANAMIVHLPEPIRAATHREPSLVLIELLASRRSVDRVVAVAPRSVASNVNMSTSREYLRSQLGLAGVLELPPAPIMTGAAIATSVFALGNYPIRNLGKGAFLRHTSAGALVEPEDQPWLSGFLNGLYGKELPGGFLAHDRSDEVWTFQAFQPGIEDTIERLRTLADLVLLGDLCQVLQGFEHHRFPESTESKGKPVIRGREVELGIAELTALPWFKIDDPAADRAQVKLGDVLIQRIAVTPKCMVVTEDLAGAIASETVIILRPKNEHVNSVLICQFLSSSAGQTLLSAHMQRAVIPMLSLERLRATLIPILPNEIVSTLSMVQGIEQDLRTRADKFAALRFGLFNADSRARLDEHLDAIRRQARAIANGIQQVETLQFQISNFHPFPLAFAYRTLAGLTDVRELYGEQLRVAENVLAFLGSMTLALVDADGLKATGFDLDQYWRGGISPGHWREICQRAAGLLRRQEDNRLSLAFAALWARKSKFSDTIGALITAINDHKHHRGPKIDDDLQSATSTVDKQLEEAMAELAFFTEYPIRQVRDVDVIRGTRRVVVKTVSFIGDHPGHPQEVLEYPVPLTKNDLYIQVQPDRWIPLYPFVSVQSCPRCKAQETYFVDKWQGPDTDALIKSFERGHTEINHEIGSGLKNW